MIPYWLVASIIWAIAVGTAGVTAKVSLRHVAWPVLLLSTTAVYVVLTIGFALKGGLGLPTSLGGWLLPVFFTGLFTAISFPLLATALQYADVSRVVPVTAAYPLVTATLSVVVLSEAMTAVRIVGTVLVVIGILLIAR